MDIKGFTSDLQLLGLSVVFYTSVNMLFDPILGTIAGIFGLGFVGLALYIKHADYGKKRRKK